MRTAQLVSDGLGLSISCQKRTNAPQQKHSYSIISSARASSVGGTVRPSIRAVLRLITSSYLFGRCTGRSLGLTLATGAWFAHLSMVVSPAPSSAMWTASRLGLLEFAPAALT